MSLCSTMAARTTLCMVVVLLPLLLSTTDASPPSPRPPLSSPVCEQPVPLLRRNAPRACSAPAVGPVFSEVAAGAGVQFRHGPFRTAPQCLFSEPRAAGSGQVPDDLLLARDMTPGVRALGSLLGTTAVDRGGSCLAERNAGGVLVGDMDGDGLPDVFAGRLDKPPVLYRNNGDGTFTDVAAERGLHALGGGCVDDVPGEALLATGSNAGAFFDADNDGDLDLFVTTLGLHRHALFINDGRGWFTEEACARGLRVTAPHDPSRTGGTSAAAADYDGDGLLDLYVAEWRMHYTRNFSRGAAAGHATNSRLFRNLGGGRFEDATDAAGVAMARRSTDMLLHDQLAVPVPDSLLAEAAARRQPPPVRTITNGVYTFSPAWVDVDDDGWDDLFIASDFMTSVLFWNNGDGTFTEGSRAAALGADQNGMGVAVADVDHDGKLDLFVSAIHSARPPSELTGFGTAGSFLYLNRCHGPRGSPDCTFLDATDAAGVRDGFWSWGAAFLDADNDGAQDLFVANGYLMPESTFDDEWNRTPNRLYLNTWRRGRGNRTAGVGTRRAGDMRDGVGSADAGTVGIVDTVADAHDSRRVDGVEQASLPTTAAVGTGGTATFVPLGSPPAAPWRSVAEEVGLADMEPGRGVAVFDYDLDGDLDVFVASFAGVARLFRNDRAACGRAWLRVRVQERPGGRDSIGAVVTVVTRTGGDASHHRQTFRVGSPSAFQGQSETTVHAGLGVMEASDAVDVHIRWPHPPQTVALRDVQVGTTLVVVRPQAGSAGGDTDVDGARRVGHVGGVDDVGDVGGAGGRVAANSEGGRVDGTGGVDAATDGGRVGQVKSTGVAATPLCRVQPVVRPLLQVAANTNLTSPLDESDDAVGGDGWGPRRPVPGSRLPAATLAAAGPSHEARTPTQAMREGLAAAPRLGLDGLAVPATQRVEPHGSAPYDFQMLLMAYAQPPAAGTPTPKPAHSITGAGNHPSPLVGRRGTPLRRQAPALYVDGVSEPVGQSHDLCDGPPRFPDPFARPGARCVSNALFSQRHSIPDPVGLSDLAAHFGQFLAHDLSHVTPQPNPSPSSFLPIPVPTGDPVFDPNATGTAILRFRRSGYIVPRRKDAVAGGAAVGGDAAAGGGAGAGAAVDGDAGAATGAAAATSTAAAPATTLDRGVVRQHPNGVTCFLDASAVYGSTRDRMQALRKWSGGLLHTANDEASLPVNRAAMPNDNPLARRTSALHLAGDVRVNIQPGLLAMHTLFVREHNLVAGQLLGLRALHAGMFSSLDGDRGGMLAAGAMAATGTAGATDGNSHQDPLSDEALFRAARRIVVAELQAVVYYEYLPALLGSAGRLSAYTGYKPDVSPAITTEFATAAFRFGHSQAADGLRLVTAQRMDARETPGVPASARVSCAGRGRATAASRDRRASTTATTAATATASTTNGCASTNDWYVPLNATYFEPRWVQRFPEGGVDPLLRGMAVHPAEAVDASAVDGLRNHLFGAVGAGGTDLVAVNIQRGRDHGLPAYNDARAAYGLPRHATFLDVTGGNTTAAHLLARLYASVDALDLFVGGLVEPRWKDSALGETFTTIVAAQFEALRDGDRFYFENRDTRTAQQVRDNVDAPVPMFPEEQVQRLRQTRMRHLLARHVHLPPAFQRRLHRETVFKVVGS